MARPLFLFDTTHHALWAEELAREAKVAYEIVPAPAASGALCDIAIETLPEGIDALSAVLERSGVEYRLFRLA